MSEREALPFLRVPPFPGARRQTLVEAGEPAGVPDVAAVADALREARVGGDFWAAQPAVPETPYLLVRGERTAPSQSAPVVRWRNRTGSSEVEGETLVTGTADPWHLVSGAAAVAPAGDDELALLAALAGKPLLYDGEDEPRPLPEPELFALVHRLLLDGLRYRNPFTGEPEGVLDAIAHAAAWRGLIDRNRSLSGAIGFARWKRTTTEALLWGGSDPVRFDPSLADLNSGDTLAAWRSRVAPATLRALDSRQVTLVEVEDGFIRSAGLGANCVPPLSIVVDSLGPHFDPRTPSELERLLETETFPVALLDQAEALRQRIVASGIGKYDAGHTELARRAAGDHVLVPGQVEDDRAVLSAIGDPLTNLALLKAARAAEPDAYLIYKPHPDVEAGHRRGAIPDALALTIADEIIRDVPMSSVIDLADRLHVNSSLAGFEALLRGKRVVTHGVPFYAGWGLTDDRGPVPERRTARRSLLELIAATLLLYPRYLDPITGLPCGPEVVVERLAVSARLPPAGALVKLRRWQGKVRQQLTRLGGMA